MRTRSQGGIRRARASGRSSGARLHLGRGDGHQRSSEEPQKDYLYTGYAERLRDWSPLDELGLACSVDPIERSLDGKHRPLLRRARHANRAAVRFDEAPDHPQSETCPSHAMGALRPLEGLEDPACSSSGIATVVAYGEERSPLQGPRARRRSGSPRRTSARSTRGSRGPARCGMDSE